MKSRRGNKKEARGNRAKIPALLLREEVYRDGCMVFA